MTFPEYFRKYPSSDLGVNNILHELNGEIRYNQACGKIDWGSPFCQIKQHFEKQTFLHVFFKYTPLKMFTKK